MEAIACIKICQKIMRLRLDIFEESKELFLSWRKLTSSAFCDAALFTVFFNVTRTREAEGSRQFSCHKPPSSAYESLRGTCEICFTVTTTPSTIFPTRTFYPLYTYYNIIRNRTNERFGLFVIFHSSNSR